MTHDDRQCAASNEDLRRGALEHYERLSKAASEWHSAIPRAINFYFDRQTAPSAPLPEDFERGEVVNLADNAAERYGTGVTAKGVYMLAKAVLAMDEHITALRARLQDEIAKREQMTRERDGWERDHTHVAGLLQAAESRAAALQKQRDEEIDEFNAGYEAYKNGVRLDDLPSTPHDQMGIGWAWAAIGPLQKDKDRLDWLEEQSSMCEAGNERWHSWEVTAPEDFHGDVRAAIDAALSKESPGE